MVDVWMAEHGVIDQKACPHLWIFNMDSLVYHLAIFGVLDTVC